MRRICSGVKTVVLLSVICVAALASAQEFREVTPDYRVAIPDDFYCKKDYRVQWWYFTGHLSDGKDGEFGYELTFFVVNVQKRPFASRFGVNRVYVSHFAITDVRRRAFSFRDEADVGVYGYAGADEARLNVWVGNSRLTGTDKEMRLEASDSDKSIDLRLFPVKPVVLNGERGYSRKSEESPLIASVYFSYTNILTRGRVKIGDTVYEVTGKSWFDREISTRGLSERQAGWDWFAIQLDDGREIMLYLLRNRDGSFDRHSSGTFVYPDGTYRTLSRDDFSVSVLSHYRSRATGARYPARWTISIPSEHVAVKIVPLLEDQEVVARETTGNYYWEGACLVEGSAKGRAYVEMTGY